MAYTTVDGLRHAPFMQAAPPEVIITQLNQPSDAADGVVVCVALQRPCSTLAALCPTDVCRYAMSNARNSSTLCCPIGAVQAAV